MTTDTPNSAVQCEFDAATGVATLTLAMQGKVNKINREFGEGLNAAIDWAKAQSGLKGIVITSAHKDFCVGADIDLLYRERDPAQMFGFVTGLAAVFRKLETCGVPVASALVGSALGGGYELALATHHRVALDSPKVVLGLPEVQLGVLPGGGGTQRLPRLIGLQPALEMILQAQQVRAPKAVGKGLVDELAPTRDEVVAKAKAWVIANPKASKQPWDAGKPIPGMQPNSPDARNLFMASCGMLEKKTAGAFESPKLAVAAIQEGTALTFDRGMEVEARLFVKLAVSDQAKDMIRTLWFFKNAAEKHQGLPSTADMGIETVTILGAGMMGAALAFVAAQGGMRVVMKDIKQEALDKGLDHVKQLVGELKHLDADAKQQLLDRVTGTLDLAQVHETDLVIEAVFENLALKHRVTQEVEPRLSARGIWASNTSALPISDLATASSRPDKFIGLHFFSPVEKMPLLEIIVGKGTSDETLARCLAFTRAIKKIPIVVNDGYAFYTTRVFSAYVLEGAQLVAEGHDPVLVEWAARRTGMVVPPLQVFDEVTLSLAAHAFTQGREYGRALDLSGVALVQKLVEIGRTGKAAGQGFYDYRDGKRQGVWAGLRALAAEVSGDAPKPSVAASVPELSRRILAAQAVEAARAADEGILRNFRDAEVGAVFGVGFAPNRGGPFAHIDRTGVAAFVAELDDYAARFGARYQAPQLLRTMAAEGRTFFGDGLGDA
jgi:3-hydroxyacyl-CoA dehydrogenase/enoyl-CoA hydratase/3-hydroxybutyryl-CoA epimerase